jgi:hypothetical protein
MNLIGISGLAGAGKDTAAEILVKEFGFVRVALADPIKRICKEVFEFTDEQLWGSSERRNAVDERYLRGWLCARSVSAFLTPRYALQTLGTEWGRDCYPDVWIDIAIRTANGRREMRVEGGCTRWCCERHRGRTSSQAGELDMTQRDDDIAMLRRLIAEATKATDDGVDEPPWFDAFGGMLVDLESGRWNQLTEKQRLWARGVTERAFDEPTYENVFSAGKIPRGLHEVPTPAVLQNLPMKPPGRR